MIAQPGAPAPDETIELAMSDGARIGVRRYGTGRAKPCLVMSHGNGFAIDGYRVFWEPLLARYELALFDTRNHGRNPRISADGHHYHQLALDTGTIARAMRERLRGQPMIGVFHSMSARAAMKHAVQMDWAWDALALFDPPNMPPPAHRLYGPMRTFEMKLVDFAVGRPEQFESVEAYVKQLTESRATSRWQRQAIVDMAHAQLEPDPAGGFRLVCRPALEAMIYLAALTMDLWPPAREYRGPVLLVGADPELKGSPPTGLANQALAAEEGYRFAFVPETTHLLQIERPAECAEVFEQFLREVL